MHGHGAEQGRGAGAGGAGIPDVAVGMPLHVEVDADILAQALLVLEQQAVGAVAGAFLGAAGAVVVVELASGDAEHQCMLAVGVAQQGRAVEAFIDAAGGQAEAPAGLVLFGEACLGRDQVDHPAHRAAAIEHRTRSLHHFGALQQAEVEEGGQRALWLRRVDAHAVDHQHGAFLLHAAQHRVLTPGAVAVHGQAGLAAEQAAGRAAGFGRPRLQHFDGLRNILGGGLVALGRDDGFLQFQRGSFLRCGKDG